MLQGQADEFPVITVLLRTTKGHMDCDCQMAPMKAPTCPGYHLQQWHLEIEPDSSISVVRFTALRLIHPPHAGCIPQAPVQPQVIASLGTIIHTPHSRLLVYVLYAILTVV